MVKPWSISTTVRNPERIRDFLKILKKMEGEEWNRDNQKKFQILLIQHKIYGYGNQQFYNNLTTKHLKLMSNDEPIKFDEAKEILDSKNYTGGGDMRGRQSFNPLEKMGLAFLDEKNKIRISAVGDIFLKENYDLAEVFFKSFIKWQLPNPDSDDFKEIDGYNIKPFISTLHLINLLNKKWKDKGHDPVGISRKEFSLFIPTLVNFKDVGVYVDKIINLRLKTKKEKDKKEFFIKYSYDFVKDFLKTNDDKLIKRTLDNLNEYTDNIIRYFRLTKYIRIRGNGYFVDIESRRILEIESLLKEDSGKPDLLTNRKEYIEYLSDIDLPKLHWENIESLRAIAEKIDVEILDLENQVGLKLIKKKDFRKLNLVELKKYIEELREYRRRLQEEIEHQKSQDTSAIEHYIAVLTKELFKMEARPLVLEKYISLSLNALNDAIRIKPNYPVGDDNEPTNTAPAGTPDIECFYENHNAIYEVTLLKDKTQWFNEGQPVMRHLRDFEEKNSKKENFCVFIAPNLHIDTVETFWMSVDYGYKGKKQKIIPLTLKQFVELLETLLILKKSRKKFTKENLIDLYKKLLTLDKIKNSEEWIEKIPIKIGEWRKSLLDGRNN